MITFTAVQVTELSAILIESADLKLATDNNRTSAFKALTAAYSTAKAPEMDDFKDALSHALSLRFGKADETNAAYGEMPQVVKDWAGHIVRAMNAGIKPAALKGKTESVVKAEINIEKAVKGGTDRAALMAKIGPKVTLAKATDAIKELANPEIAAEIKAMKQVLKAVSAGLTGHSHEEKMVYMSSLITYVLSDPFAEELQAFAEEQQEAA